MAEIRLDGVSKVYDGGVRAVDDVSLDVADGEFMVLVGPSGCGKSTLLRMIAGLERVDGGRVLIGDRDVTGVDPPERDIAMVFQNYALYPHKTVRENLAFGLRQRKTPREQIDGRVGQIGGMLGLGELMERRPSQLSGGQRQRVAIGRALVREPQVFLLDEPLSNLDAKLRTSMRSELSRLHERLRVTTVYVTHDQIEAMTLGERVAVLRDGVIQQCDTPQALFRSPRNLFVAAFIGSPAMNLVEASLKDGAAHFAGHRLPLDGYRGPARKAILGVRPTAFVPAADGEPAIEASVQSIEHLGDELRAFFELEAPEVQAESVRAAADVESDDEGRLLAEERRARFVACLDGRAPVVPGEQVRLAVDPRDLHLFDAETGDALSS